MGGRAPLPRAVAPKGAARLLGSQASDTKRRAGGAGGRPGLSGCSRRAAQHPSPQPRMAALRGGGAARQDDLAAPRSRPREGAGSARGPRPCRASPCAPVQPAARGPAEQREPPPAGAPSVPVVPFVQETMPACSDGSPRSRKGAGLGSSRNPLGGKGTLHEARSTFAAAVTRDWPSRGSLVRVSTSRHAPGGAAGQGRELPPRGQLEGPIRSLRPPRPAAVPEAAVERPLLAPPHLPRSGGPPRLPPRREGSCAKRGVALRRDGRPRRGRAPPPISSVSRAQPPSLWREVGLTAVKRKARREL
ncbi:basic salivary proline-rich protein 3-like [Varanus komodoensis]|uniref:basic salivary proline-rich protein 3-like n=1 Tax=Varanus komodoensis TaxID=61221 RepID=UPI001CF79DD1|nr:basic salivary proline-rich protein 3-like [Varanus komodoensis]